MIRSKVTACLMGRGRDPGRAEQLCPALHAPIALSDSLFDIQARFIDPARFNEPADVLGRRQGRRIERRVTLAVGGHQ